MNNINTDKYILINILNIQLNYYMYAIFWTKQKLKLAYDKWSRFIAIFNLWVQNEVFNIFYQFFSIKFIWCKKFISVYSTIKRFAFYFVIPAYSCNEKTGAL